MDRNIFKYKEKKIGFFEFEKIIFPFSLNAKNIKENYFRYKSAIFWFIIEMIIVKNESFNRFYQTDFINSIKKEIKLANINKNDKVLHIGCGPYPISLLLIKKLTGASVVAIDRTDLAVGLAKKYIKNKKIKGVEIKYSDGQEISAEDFDVIILTSAVSPRDKVLKNILTSSKNKCRIICRELDCLKKSTEDFISNNGFKITDWVLQKPKWISYLIVKSN